MSTTTETFTMPTMWLDDGELWRNVSAGPFNATFVEPGARDRPYPGVEAVCIIVIVLATFISNALILCVILMTPFLKNITGYFIFALAVNDLLYGACFSVSIPSVLYQRWIMSDVACDWIGYFYNVTYHNSIHSFVFVTIDRYICITRPFRYHAIMTKRVCFAIIAFGWLISFAAVSPTALGFGNFAYRPDVYWCGIEWKRSWKYTLYTTCIFMPDLGIILYTYFSIWKISRFHSRSVSKQQTLFSEEHKESRDKALRILIVMGISFVNGWFPYLISQLYSALSPYPLPYVANFLFGWVSTSNAFWDSFLYIISNQSMRRGFRRMFSKWFGCVKYTSDDINNHHETYV